MQVQKKSQAESPPAEGPAPTSETKKGDAGATRGRAALLGVIGFSVLGLIDMIYLTRLHWSVHSIPDFSSFCSISAEVDCDAVAASPFSVLFGVPVSFWGVLAYVALIAVAVWGLKAMAAEKAHQGAGLGLLTLAAAGSLLTSAVLGYISAVYIESFCILCAAGYVINIGIGAAVAAGLWSHRLCPFKAIGNDLSFLLERPKATASLAGSCLVVAAGTLAFYPSPEARAEDHEPERLQVTPVSAGLSEEGKAIMSTAFSEEAAFKGARDAPVTIVEFTDYECGFCKRSHAEMKSLLAPYEGRYQILHRHFPLDQACNPSVPRPFNQNACTASRHALCAGEQGLFWELNSLLFAVRGRLDASTIRDLAKRAGCDMDALDACLAGDAPDRVLERDIRDGMELGVRGTPTFFINGERIVGLPRPEMLAAFFRVEHEEN